MKMIDFIHKNKPDFIQLVLIMAVVCLALGAITPAASAVNYDWDFTVSPVNSGIVDLEEYENDFFGFEFNEGFTFDNAFNGYTVYCGMTSMHNLYGYAYSDLSSLASTEIYNLPTVSTGYQPTINYYSVNLPTSVDAVAYSKTFASWLISNTDISTDVTSYMQMIFHSDYFVLVICQVSASTSSVLTYDYVSDSGYDFSVDVVDSGDDYQISVSGFDGTQLAGSAYTIAVSTYSGGYNLPLTSFPMYLGDFPVHLWTTDQTFTLPIYLSDGVTPIDYYCMLSFPADPTATGYPFWWNMTTHGSTEYPFNTTYPPVVLPTPTPLIPSDIIPDPNDLNNTVNFTGWYQDQGFEGNNITAPIYSGLRGWFNENMIPVFDFFLMPIGSLSSMISESASTSTDAISDSVNQLSIYAAPMSMVGGYVVLLVPDVVWVVVFAALSIGYVVLLIRISTGSIRDTIGRFLGRW